MKPFFLYAIRNTLCASCRRGFAIYYAVLFSGLLLTVGISMLGISLKELVLSASLKESENAFFAADSGAECAAYWDLRTPGFFPVYLDPNNVKRTAPSLGYAGAAVTTAAIPCEGSSTWTLLFLNMNPSTITTTFSYNVNGAYCTYVSVKKTITGPSGAVETKIDARGYNVPGSTVGVVFSCNNNTSSRKVERALTIKY